MNEKNGGDGGGGGERRLNVVERERERMGEWRTSFRPSKPTRELQTRECVSDLHHGAAGELQSIDGEINIKIYIYMAQS